MPRNPNNIFALCEDWQAANDARAAAIAAVAAEHDGKVDEAFQKVKDHKDYHRVSGLFEAPKAQVAGGEPVYAQCKPDGTVFNKTSRLVTTVAPSLKATHGDSLDGYFVKVLATDEVVSTNLTWRKAREASA